MSKKFHICFISQNFPVSRQGVNQTSLWPIAENLALKGNKVSIITHKEFHKNNPTNTENLNFYFTSTQSDFISIQEFPKIALKKIKELSSSEEIHHVHSIDTFFKSFKSEFKGPLKKRRPTLSYGRQASSMNQMFSLFGISQNNLKNILKSHFISPLYFLKTFFTKDFFPLRQSQGFFVNSPKEALTLERYYLYPPNQIFQIPLDSYISNLSEKEKSKELLTKLGLKKDTPVIATVSDMKRSYEIFFLLDVFEKVAISNPKAKLLILGAGAQFKQIQRQVLLKALDNRVIFAKNISIDKLPEYVSVSDIFININSTTSGLGPTLMEAMAQGKVIVGSEFSPISNVIENSKNGFLIRPGETVKCFNLIDDIFSGKIDKNVVGKQAKEDIYKLLDRDKLTEKTLKAFKKIHSTKSKLLSF